MADAFTLDEFRRQLRQLREVGAIRSKPTDSDEGPSLESIERIIDAMTESERRDPAGIDKAGRQRIAGASGVDEQDVARYLVQFKQLQIIMRQMREGLFPGT
jgi:signal recognition particle subunit SRP54